MDTLIVFCALVFAAATLSFISMCISAVVGLVTGSSRRVSTARSSALAVNPFEPSDTQHMHVDPRMFQQTRVQKTANTNLPVRSTAVALVRPQGRVVPRRVVPARSLTQRPQRLLAC